MSFESPDNEKDFPGLYAPDQVSVTEEDHDKQSTKKKDGVRKKDGRKEKKDKGYKMFEEEESEEELVLPDDLKSPSKVKKIKPTFRFPKKDLFPKSKEKEEKKEKEGRRKDETRKEEKKKEDKEGKKEKHKLKEKKKSKHRDVSVVGNLKVDILDKPVFGVPLSLSVERSKCHDGIELPAIFRECIDYIEEHSLACEGIYRISGVKSKVQQLKECYNKSLPAYLYEHEPNVVASLLKQFLRELPEPVLTISLMPKFEEASTLKSQAKKVEAFRMLEDDLPICNKLLLSWMIVHMTHIIEHQKQNKMTLQNVSIVLSPTMQISHRVLNVFFSHAKQLFQDTQIKKYVPPLRPATSRWSLELPDNPAALEEELSKQESLLNALHEELKMGVEDQTKEEQLWEVQRVVTQLKRKIKFVHKASDVTDKRKKEMELHKKPKPVLELDELNLELQPLDESAEEEHVTVETKELGAATESTPAEGVLQIAESQTQEEFTAEKAETDEPVPETEDSKPETEDSKPETKDPEPETEDSKPETNDSKPETEDSKPETNDSKPETNDSKPETEDSKPETKDSKPETKDSKPEPETKDSKPETTDSKPETTDSKPETNDPETEYPVEKVDGGEMTGQAETPDVSPTQAERPAEMHTQPDDEDDLQLAEATCTEAEEIPKVKESKPTGPVQPHLQMSQQPLQPIKVSPQKVADNSASSQESSTLAACSAEGRELEPREGDADESSSGKDVILGAEYKPRSADLVPDEEMKQLLEEEYALTLEEEELLAIGDELKQKIETEQSEIERLKQEIVELQYLRQDSDLEDYSSSSDSSYESEDEEELTELLNTLIAENEQLEKKNSEMCQKIHDERMACLDCKVSIGLIQQQQLYSDNILDRDNPI